MKNKIIMTIVGVSLFTGCLNTYDISPSYDKIDKTVTINNTKFENVIQVRNKYIGMGQKGNSRTNIQYYKLDNRECKTIQYRYSKAGTKTYFTSSAYDRIINKYKGGSCIVTKIANLKLLSCKFGNYGVEQNFITTDSNNKWGYSSIQGLYLSPKCFTKVKNVYILCKNGLTSRRCC